MAEIYDYGTAEPLALGLQGALVCDEAINLARWYAANNNEPVVLEDDDGYWLVSPDGGVEEIDDDWDGGLEIDP